MTFHAIHHLTAVTADAQANVDFYVGLLGKGVKCSGPERLGGTTRLTLQDSGGLTARLVFAPDAPAGHPWEGPRLPAHR